MKETIDLGRTPVGRLFRQYFVPTLMGMLSLCVVTAADGVFVGRGIGSEAVAAVNIVWAPMMVMIGVGLMLGIGCSVVASIYLAQGEVMKARRNVSYALIAGTVIVLVYVLAMLASPADTCYLLGSSETLLGLAIDYLVFFTPGLVLNMWSLIGLFIVRLDGSPRLAMWCNVVPGLLNILLDYLFIFPLGWGMKGAAAATGISVTVGGFMTMIYLARYARSLRLVRVSVDRGTIGPMLKSIGYQMRIGVSAFLGESTMAMLMFVGNLVFMHYLGDAGVAAFGVACYYCPFFFMIGNAIAQSAQPIISYNYGLGDNERVAATERVAICTALSLGTVIMFGFMLFPSQMVGLFIGTESLAARYAIDGLPWFATCVIFFIFNLTAIGYYQSVERVAPSVWFALLRGCLLLVPSFVLLPLVAGVPGIWLAVGVSEILTTISIVVYYVRRRARG